MGIVATMCTLLNRARWRHAMPNTDFDTRVTHIAPGRNPADRHIAQQLRAAGLWDTLCREALWQCAANDGTPVHNESTALWAMLDHVGQQENGAAELGDRMVESLGPQCVAEALARAGRKHLSMSAWGYWKRRIGLPPVPGDGEGYRFADGWVERLGVRDDGEETPPGCIPDTFEGEKVAWGCHPETGKVYPVPY